MGGTAMPPVSRRSPLPGWRRNQQRPLASDPQNINPRVSVPQEWSRRKGLIGQALFEHQGKAGLVEHRHAKGLCLGELRPRVGSLHDG